MMFDLRCFCTLGRGSRDFAVAELKSKFSSDIEFTDEMEGKLFFQIDVVNIDRLKSLKCIERIFFLLHYDPKITFNNKSDINKLNTAVKEISKFHEYYRYLEELRMNKSDGNMYEPDSKRTKMMNDKKDVTFRVSCKSSNKYVHIRDISRTIGCIVKKQTNWIIDLKKPEIEVIVHINHSGTVIGIPVFKKPLADRSYIKYAGLRSTIAWILASLTDIQEGDIVIDPMCGNCIIPIEASKEWKGTSYLASDISQEAMEKSFSNLMNAEETSSIDLFKADITELLALNMIVELPLPDSSVDKIICDLPFGNKHGEFEKVKQMYPKIFQSMDRILKPGGKAVLLTSTRLKDELIQICTHKEVSTSTKDKERHNLNDCSAEIVIESGELNQACNSNQVHFNMINEKFRVINNVSESNTSDIKNQQVENLEKSVNCTPFLNVKWTLNSDHYLKMGEMHSVACCFTKSLTK